MTPFVHLHVHTPYSLLDSTCRIGDLVEAAAAQEVKAVAMTDHTVMYGALDFYRQCRERGVRPLIGCEMYVAREGLRDTRSELEGNPNDHLVLLARDLDGYRNLVRLTSIAHLEGFHYKPRIDKEQLARYGKGLIGLSGCLQGEVNRLLLDDDEPGARRAAGAYAEIFGPNGFYLEFQDHGIPEQIKVNRALGKLSKKTKIPIVATNDVHYLRREHASTHELLLCVQTGTTMSDPARTRFPSSEFYLKTGDEMARLAREFPGAAARTVEVAEQCDVILPPPSRARPGVRQDCAASPELGGRHNRARIIAFKTFTAREAERTVLRAMNMPREKWSERQGHTEPVDVRVADMAARLEGNCRAFGVQEKGWVRREQLLDGLIPLGRDKDGRPITQYSEGHMRELGLLQTTDRQTNNMERTR